MKKIIPALFVLAAMSVIPGCKKGGLNVFTIQDDKNFGLQMEAEIASNPSQFPLLSKTQYASAYNYLESMKQTILASGQLKYANEFQWKLYIIQDDATLNAFCTPGGYIYIYTGLIKYLDNASSLAGVLGHEMAHADQRHSTQQLTKQYGLSLLVAVVAGTTNAGQLAEIAAGLTSLAFSRDHEKDADEHSVKYLCPTKYKAEGASYFFQKLEAGGVSCSSLEAFFSTHPCPDNRVANIQSNATSQNCAVNNNISANEDVAAYNAFKASLP
ncbi:MAG: M48 family metalloprotease [Chitinophagales bacterium]|nr:M48 family metalloprotease [Chitinophagales bacterium]